MTTAIQAHSQAAIMEAGEVARDLERLTHLLPSLRECPKAKAEASSMLPAITAPANPVWVMARVAALLNPYFEKDTPQAVREIEAEDWAVALRGIPQWALENAVRWWKSADNPDRRKRPLEGDIAARCKVEMMAVRAAQINLNATGKTYQPQPSEREAMDDATRAERSQSLTELAAHLRAKAEGSQ